MIRIVQLLCGKIPRLLSFESLSQMKTESLVVITLAPAYHFAAHHSAGANPNSRSCVYNAFKCFIYVDNCKFMISLNTVKIKSMAYGCDAVCHHMINNKKKQFPEFYFRI